MSEQKKEVTSVHFNVSTELYTQYKIALLQRFPRRNVTQDIVNHMRVVIEETSKLNQ